jgi:hypothetical protein
MLKWDGGGNTPTLKIMKKYLITTNTIVKGERVSAGSIVELEESVGRELMGYGKAEEHHGKEPKIADRSVGLEESEAPKVTKRKGKK